MSIGAVIQKPELLDTDAAKRLNEFDFADPLHRMVFFTISNLYQEGHTKITGSLIDEYLVMRPKMFDYFHDRDGYAFINEAVDEGIPTSFAPNVDKIKKLSLLRGMEHVGVDVSFLLDWDTEDRALKQSQNDYIDQHTILEIGSIISDRIDDAIAQADSNASGTVSAQGGKGLRGLVERLKEEPEMGSPLYGGLINTMTRGARLGKFYLRSAPTGGGKSRMMVADTLNFACDKIFDTKSWTWKDNGVKEGALFITTELDIEETQTLELAFLSGIDEEKILNGEYSEKEEEVIMQAITEIEESPVWIDYIADFSIAEIERIIRRQVRENDVKYVSFDYIHMSMKFLQEVATMSNGMKLREDQILFMLSSKLKDLANELGIFIQSATQLNGNWQEAEEINQNLLRGSKAIADRVDVGLIAMKSRAIDEDVVETFVAAGYPRPNYVLHFYKIRRGKYAGSKLWCHADLGTCRIDGLFVTGYDNQPIPVQGMDVKVVKAVQKATRIDKAEKQMKSAF